VVRGVDEVGERLAHLDLDSYTAWFGVAVDGDLMEQRVV